MSANIQRLQTAGYDDEFIQRSITDMALSYGKWKGSWKEKNGDLPVIAIQFTHYAGHWLKNLAAEFDVTVVFKYGNKLSRLPAMVNNAKKPCMNSGHESLVECVDRVVYSVPLSCGMEYIGQTSRCLNKRLYEHRKSLTCKYGNQSVTLKNHLQGCDDCTPMFSDSKVLARLGSKRSREISESVFIQRSGEKVISTGSVKVNNRECDFITQRSNKYEAHSRLVDGSQKTDQ